MKRIIILAGALAVLAPLAGCKANDTGSQAAAAKPAAAYTAPAVVPSPAGTWLGACSYTIGSDPVDGTAVAIGDVEVTNTGNVAIRVRVVITWPQQGYRPLVMDRHVRLAAGAADDVEFHRPLSYDQLSELQAWQTGHGYADGCTYKGTITWHAKTAS